MAELRLIRKAVTANAPVIFEFEAPGIWFLIKNLTEGDIYVALKSGATKEESALIPRDCAQVLEARYKGTGSIDATQIVQVIADTTSTKGVEVQCIYRWG